MSSVVGSLILQQRPDALENESRLEQTSEQTISSYVMC